MIISIYYSYKKGDDKKMAKIMYNYHGWNKKVLSLAIPSNFYELKALVHSGFCVMNREDVDLREYFWYEPDDYTDDDLKEIFDMRIEEFSELEIEKALLVYDDYVSYQREHGLKILN